MEVMERIVRKHILQHLNNNQLVSSHQHGFVHRRLCQTNLLEAWEEWTKILDEGNGLDVVYLDYSKVFDSVPHKRLLKNWMDTSLVGLFYNGLLSYCTTESRESLCEQFLLTVDRSDEWCTTGVSLGPNIIQLFCFPCLQYLSRSM